MTLANLSISAIIRNANANQLSEILNHVPLTLNQYMRLETARRLKRVSTENLKKKKESMQREVNRTHNNANKHALNSAQKNSIRKQIRDINSELGRR